MVSIDQIIDTLTTITQGKTVLFIIAALLFFAYMSFRKVTKYEKNKDTGRNEVVTKYNPITKKQEPVKYSYPILGIILSIVAILITSYNYLTPLPPSYTYTPEIVAGNSTKNISDTNYQRLDYISKSLNLVKLSIQGTPSRFDIDDNNIDNNREYWKQEAIVPYWDCHIATDGTWTWVETELYFPTNGATPIGEKHSHDFENFYLYYYENETTPRYIAFPTFVGITEHPKVLLKWSEVPQVDGEYFLRLDPSTNAFHEKYEVFPKPDRNYIPKFVSPEINELGEYISDLELIIVVISSISALIVVSYMFIQKKYRHKYFFLLFLFIAILIYPLITLQYDYVGNASFRVWQDGEKPDTSIWLDSREGRDYIEDYGGLPYDRGRWTDPPFRTEIGIK